MIQIPRTSFDVIQCGGGWDQITPTLSLKSGVARDSINFECNVSGGYTKIDGYERFDGRPRPSDAVYSVVWFTAMVNVPAVGNTLVNAAATASGVIAEIHNDHIILTKLSGSFSTGDTVKVGATIIAVLIDAPTTITQAEDATDAVAAQNIYRADILVVPGSGSLIGGFLYNDIIYAFRPNAGNTAIDIYKSSTGGWTAVPLFYEVYFTAASVAPAEGGVLTQGAVTSTVKRVVLQSGAYAGGTAAGKMIITAPAGGNYAAGAFTGGMTGTCSGIQTAITLTIGGKIEYVEANFTGATATKRIYACDGVNRAFEFDGTVLVPIDTGTTPNNPKHIVSHKNALHLMIGSSSVISAPGLPYNYTALSGAVEIALGEEGTGYAVVPGSITSAALVITTLNNTNILYGSSSASWNLTTFNTGYGALHYSVLNMAQTLGFDARGVFSLQTTLAYGNFDPNMLTYNIKPFIESKYKNFAYAGLNRRKSQYRLFFNDGSGLYVTIVNGKWIGSMPIQFPVIFRTVIEDRMNDGSEVSFAFGENGYVYQLDKGVNFDGQTMEHFVTLIYNSIRSPRILKRFMRASIELYGNGWVSLDFGYSLGYGRQSISQSPSRNYQNSYKQIFFDAGFKFDSGITFDAKTIEPVNTEINGTAENVAYTIGAISNSIAAYTINTIITHYQQRRAMR